MPFFINTACISYISIIYPVYAKDDALELNIIQGHYLEKMWINCVDCQPPNVDPCELTLICDWNTSYNVKIGRFI